VYEKFHEQMQSAFTEISGVRKVLARWAKDAAIQANVDIQNK
jgi:hypothetical protein